MTKWISNSVAMSSGKKKKQLRICWIFHMVMELWRKRGFDNWSLVHFDQGQVGIAQMEYRNFCFIRANIILSIRKHPLKWMLLILSPTHVRWQEQSGWLVSMDTKTHTELVAILLEEPVVRIWILDLFQLHFQQTWIFRFSHRPVANLGILRQRSLLLEWGGHGPRSWSGKITHLWET